MIPFYENKTDLLRVETGCEKTFPLHLHVCPELLYLVSGTIEAQVGDGCFVLRSGDFLLVFPNLVHGYRTISPPADTRFQLAICRPYLAGDLADRLLTQRPRVPVIRAADLHKDVPYAMADLLEIAETSDTRVIQPLFQLILARALPLLDLETAHDLPSPDLTVQVIVYLSAHYREPLSLQSLSAVFGVGRFRLSRLFTRTVHVGFYPYIHRLRIDYAKHLLETTSRGVLDIALDSGFESQQTFNRVFRDQCGMTPRDYRVRHRR